MKKLFAIVALFAATTFAMNAQRNPVNVTAVIDENWTNWVYVVNLTTSQGTLPIIVRRNLSAVELAEVTNENANSAYFSKDLNKWIPAVATIGPEWLEWHTTEKAYLGNIIRSTATTLGMELFAKVSLSVAPDENRKTWVYIVNLVTDHGTLPIVVRRDLSAAEPVEVTNENTNSAYFVKKLNKWIPAYAVNGHNYMEWTDTQGAVLGNMSYSTATAWNMPLRNGHPSISL